MYKYILVLKGTNKELASYEFENLWKVYFNENIKLKQIENVFFKFESKNLIKKNSDILKRLTYTNYLGLNTFKGNFNSFSKEISNLNLDKYDDKTFSVRPKRTNANFQIETEAKLLAKPIYDSFKNPKVKLEGPDIEFFFLFTNPKEFYFSEKIYENDKDYLRRMPKKRPKVMPYTLKSDMARVSINYLNIKEGNILDPFCGQGGILLEVEDMNFNAIGNDISWNDLKYMKENFKYFFPKSNYKRILADSKNQFLKENTIDGIVSDIPYGRASKKLGTDLYEEFLKSAKIYLKPNKRLVLIYANFVEFKELALKYFNEINEIEEYINKSMTRHILVLENKK